MLRKICVLLFVIVCFGFSTVSKAQRYSSINNFFINKQFAQGLNYLYQEYKSEFFINSIEKAWVVERSTNIQGSLASQDNIDLYSAYLHLKIAQDEKSHKFRCFIVHRDQSMVSLLCDKYSNCGKISLTQYLASYGEIENSQKTTTDVYIYNIPKAIDQGNDAVEYLIHLDQIFPSISNAFYYKTLDEDGQND